MKKFVTVLLSSMLIILTSWTLFYGMNGHRLSYVDLGKKSTISPWWVGFPVSLPSEHKSEIEKMKRAVLEYPHARILVLPAEDHVSVIFPQSIQWGFCPQFHPLSCPSTARDSEDFRTSPPEIVVHKIQTQIRWNPEPWSTSTLLGTRRCFNPVLNLSRTYLIYAQLPHTPACLSQTLRSSSYR